MCLAGICVAFLKSPTIPGRGGILKTVAVRTLSIMLKGRHTISADSDIFWVVQGEVGESGIRQPTLRLE